MNKERLLFCIPLKNILQGKKKTFQAVFLKIKNEEIIDIFIHILPTVLCGRDFYNVWAVVAYAYNKVVYIKIIFTL